METWLLAALIASGLGLIVLLIRWMLGERGKRKVAEYRAREGLDALAEARRLELETAAPLPSDDHMRNLGMPDSGDDGPVRPGA